MKVVENSPQNSRNCTIFFNVLEGACPQTPLAKARSFAARDMPACISKIPEILKLPPPPLRNPAYDPDVPNHRVVNDGFLFYVYRCLVYPQKGPLPLVS